MLLNFSESEAFAEAALVLRGISSPVFGMDIGCILSSNTKTCVFVEDSPRNTHSRLANQSQIISFSPTPFLLVC